MGLNSRTVGRSLVRELRALVRELRPGGRAPIVCNPIPDRGHGYKHRARDQWPANRGPVAALPGPWAVARAPGVESRRAF